MFRHQGKSRTLKQNIQIATVLSFVAGIVNITGYLSIQQLTTNVTGHFAFLINDISKNDFRKGWVYFLYIFSFLLGSIVSSLLIEVFRKNKKLNVFVVPTVLESTLLVLVAVISHYLPFRLHDVIACMLLFAMGLQNSFVTKISNAVVRTTHLTGLFTDLGIDLSHLIFPVEGVSPHKTKANIQLRLYIIIFFFLGGLVAGFLFTKLHMGNNTLLIGAIILIISLFYDDFRYRYLKIKRKRKLLRKQKTSFDSEREL